MEICKRNVTSYSNGRLKKKCCFFFFHFSRVRLFSWKKRVFPMNVSMWAWECCHVAFLPLLIRKSDLLVHLLPFGRVSTSKNWKQTKKRWEKWLWQCCIISRVWVVSYLWMCVYENWDLAHFMLRGCKRPLYRTTCWYCRRIESENLLEFCDFDCYEYETILKCDRRQRQPSKNFQKNEKEKEK